MNIGIIGFGAIGKQRYDALISLKNKGYPIDKIFIHDICEQKENGYLWVTKDEMKNKNLGLLIIATPHDVTPTVIKDFIPTKIKMLAEKPFSSSYKEAFEIYDSLLKKDQLYIGFNYRFFDGIERIYKDFKEDLFGKIYGVNIELGHGQSPKDMESWKNRPEKVLGGSMLDPGIHLLDLITKFDSSVDASIVTEIKERGFGRESNILLHGNKLGIVNLQTSLVRWKNVFKFQINGKNYSGTVSGRGGNYGIQRYTLNKKWGWMIGESESLVLETDCKNSFEKELESILFKKEYGINPCDVKEALESVDLYERCTRILNDTK